MGRMGAGKTLTMSMLTTYLAYKWKVPLYSNYHLAGSIPVNTEADLWKMHNGIFAFDELWITLDSRNFKDNTSLTEWVNQTRKKQTVVFYTTQHIDQVEKRVRNATDYLLICRKWKGKHQFQIVDYQYLTLGKRITLNNPQRFYSLYNTYEVVRTLERAL